MQNALLGENNRKIPDDSPAYFQSSTYRPCDVYCRWLRRWANQPLWYGVMLEGKQR